MSESLDEARRNFEESRTLYELLQDQVIPTYYRRGDMGYSAEWMRMAKHSIATLLPRFSSTRMVSEYLAKFYLPATRQGRRYAESELRARRAASREWKTHVREQLAESGNAPAGCADANASPSATDCVSRSASVSTA